MAVAAAAVNGHVAHPLTWRREIEPPDVLGQGGLFYAIGTYRDPSGILNCLSTGVRAFGRSWSWISQHLDAAGSALCIPGIIASAATLLGCLADFNFTNEHCYTELLVNLADLTGAVIQTVKYALSFFGKEIASAVTHFGAGLEIATALWAVIDNLRSLTTYKDYALLPSTGLSPMDKLFKDWWWKNLFSLAKNTLRITVAALAITGAVAVPWVWFALAIAYLGITIAEHFFQRKMELNPTGTAELQRLIQLQEQLQARQLQVRQLQAHQV